MELLGDALTFDDILLLPGASDVLPNETQLETDLTKKIKLNIPLLSAAMDTVTESKTAITMAQEGGLGIIHKNLTIEQQAFEVEKVKKSEWGMVLDPVTIGEDAKISEVMELTRTYKISGVPVVQREKGQEKGDARLVGIITNRDLRFEENMDLRVRDRMSKMPLVTAPPGTTLEQAKNILKEKRLEKLPVVDSNGMLKGLITIKDIEKRRAYPRAIKDSFGRLLVGAAVGVGPEGMERTAALVAAGVDVICVDSAHGHSRGVLQTVSDIKKKYGDKIQVIGGNIGTGEAAKALIDAGADSVKVGIGPGSICTTRVVTGVGVPQLYAVQSVRAVTEKAGIPLVADGGVRYSGDVTKALAMGANSVMLGSLFAGTDEAPGEIVLYQGRSYKVYRGMGSMEAMTIRGARDRYFQGDISELTKLVPEGIEGRVPYRGSLSFNVHQVLGGLRSGMGYVGAKNLPELFKRAKFVKISGNGLTENHPHDIIVTKEAPNYRLSS